MARAHGLDGSFYVHDALPELLAEVASVTVAGTVREVVRRAGTDDRPQRVHRPPAPADDLADVVLGDPQLVDRGAVVLLEGLDGHGIGIVDQAAGEELDEVVHRPDGAAIPLMRISRRTVSLG